MSEARPPESDDPPPGEKAAAEGSDPGPENASEERAEPTGGSGSGGPADTGGSGESNGAGGSGGATATGAGGSRGSGGATGAGKATGSGGSNGKENAAASADDEDEAVEKTEMTLVEHLTELRNRLLRVVIAIGVVFVACVPFADQLYTLLALPLLERLPEGSTMIATEVASPFLTPFKLAFVAAVALSIPVALHQAWSFIAPGLYLKERRLALPLLVSSVMLFFIGMAFAYYLVFPLMFSFFIGSAPDGVIVATDIGRYLDFCIKLFFAFGVAFEVPVATFLIVSAGLTTVEELRKKRAYVILTAFVVGMLLTPPDMISQTLLALPMWVLFELGLIMCRLYIKSEREAGEGEGEAGTAD